MTKKETMEVIMTILSAYPNSKQMSDRQVECMIDTWAAVFEGDSETDVRNAVGKLICTNKWMPSISEVRETMVKMNRPDIVEPGRAWEAVSDLIHSFSEFADKNLDEMLPPLIARAVRVIGWSSLCRMSGGSSKGFAEDTARKTFISVYEPIFYRERELACIPTKYLPNSSNAIEGMLTSARQAREDAERESEEIFRRRLQRNALHSGN